VKILDRNITNIANYFLDNICPPILRDQKWFMYPIIHFAYGRETKHIMEFKEKFPFLNDDEIAQYYEHIKNVPINTERATDLNKPCLNYILENIFNPENSHNNAIIGRRGATVLDVACGRGYLLKKIMEKHPGIKCMGADIVKPEIDPGFEIVQADISSLPFEDHSFDNVICTHALEHIREPRKALVELIRITRRHLIIVVPRQREYLYTVDLHVNFFPYMYSFKNFIGVKNADYRILGGDFLCSVNFPVKPDRKER
jgi:SAM-dependent methyltransferase